MTSELDRLRQTYAERNADPGLRERYRLVNPGHLFLVQERERALLDLLRRYHRADRLDRSRILDVGCGSGGLLADLVRYGARPSNLAGIDLMADDIAQARLTLPAAALHCGDASHLDWPSGHFDLVVQLTVFSSIRSATMRQAVAGEMRRVVKPDGLIISYDLRWPSPNNAAVAPIDRDQLRRLFPDCRLEARAVTLAPPLSRLIAPRAWWLANLLATIPALRSHLLAALRP